MSSASKHLSKHRTISKYLWTSAYVYKFSHSTPLVIVFIHNDMKETEHTFDSYIFDILPVIPVPENLQVDSVTTTTANLSWSLAEEMDQVPHNFEIYYDTVRCDGSFETIYTDCCRAVLTGLKPYRENYISVFTNVENLGRSQQSCICIFTGKCDS